MQTLNRLDQEVLALITTDNGVAKDMIIEESDTFKDAIYAVLVKIEDYTTRHMADPTFPAVSRHVAGTVELPQHRSLHCALLKIPDMQVQQSYNLVTERFSLACL